jgi:hypothetical protein
MKSLYTLAATAAAVAASSPVNAAPVIDGNASAAEWAGGQTIAADSTGSFGFQLTVTSDTTGLFILGETSDDDDGTNSSGNFDVFDVNIGLAGNAAAWRYRVLSQNNFFGGTPYPEALAGDWTGRFDSGDDSVVANAAFGVPGSLTESGFPSGLEWAVGLGDRSGALNRVHEIFIPWSAILDGQNGWDPSASFVELAFAGTFTQDSVGDSYTDPNKSLDFGDQSTYAFATLAVPAPGTAGALALAGFAAARRRRR